MSRFVTSRFALFSGRIAQGWRVYTERRVLIILFLGFSSGLPLALTGSTLSIWMADRGVDLGTIGLFSLVGLPYVIKPLWAPLVDAVRLPWLTARLGRRRGWLLASQLALMAAIAVMGLIDPVTAPLSMAAAALGVAFASATQDIVIDAFRVESLNESQYAAGMANYVAAYRLALLVAGAGAVALVAMFEDAGVGAPTVWSLAYGVMAVLVLIGMAAILLAPEPEPDPKPELENSAALAVARPPSWSAQASRALVQPFTDFATKPQWAAILLFVMLFKFGDAFAGAMVAPFALDLGFEKTVYAYVANGVGLPAVLLGGFLGGWLGRILSARAGLWTAGILQMVSNLAFFWLALVGPEPRALGLAVAVEAFTGGIGTVIFVAYLSSLCRSREFTATQFALLSALAAVGRTILSASSGYAAAAVGWPVFFLVTTLAAVPGLTLLWWLSRKGTLEHPTP